MYWQKAQAVAAQAMLDGTLFPISTEPRVLSQGGVQYYIHLKNANSKVKFEPRPKDFNPFLPFEPAMFVEDAGSEHVCLLNKFPVLAPHLLICSKDFVEQTAPLQQSDFAAWLMGMTNDRALGFYNGGRVAGASQRHRHMQLIQSDVPTSTSITSGQLPFAHRLYQFNEADAAALYANYVEGMSALRLYDETECRPHNLLLTRNWFLIVPRVTNNVNGVFANGINYSGHFLLTDESQIDWLESYGVMQFLADCATA